MIEKISFAEISKESSIIRQMARIINDLIGAIDKLEKHKHSYFDTQKYQTTLVSTSTPIVEDKPECDKIIVHQVWFKDEKEADHFVGAIVDDAHKLLAVIKECVEMIENRPWSDCPYDDCLGKVKDKLTPFVEEK